MTQPRWIGATEVREAVSPEGARRLLRQALVDGLDPGADPARLSPFVEHGQLLIMPSATPTAVGVKVASVAPDNPARGLDRIQAVYVLMDAETLTPSVLIDGVALTSLRTPAMSAVAMECLAPNDVSSVVVFGSGPQAIGHVEALLALRRPELVTVVARRAEPLRRATQAITALGSGGAGTSGGEGMAVGGAATERHPPASRGGRPSPRVEGVSASDLATVADRVRQAQVVIAATSSATPVLDSSWVADGACVVAVGSHEPDRRELDGLLMGRSLVVVEDVATALREAGDVVMAAHEGALDVSGLHAVRALVTGSVTRADDRPNVFKSVGMAWQDLVVAEGVSRATASGGPAATR